MKHFMHAIGVVATVYLIVCLAPIVSAANSSLKTPEELQSMFDQGQYSTMLSDLNATLAAKSSPTDKPVRYTLLMLKGEALLRTKSADAAFDAFHAASLIGPDDKSIALARATASLIKHSSAGKYQPKSAAGATTAAAIDIVDPNSRKQAFAALFTDLTSQDKPAIEKAEKQITLPPIEEAAAQLADIRPVEIAATDADKQSSELLKKLGQQAITLMNAALKNLDAQTANIAKIATRREKQLQGRSRTINANDKKEGLLPENVDSLDNIASQAQQIGSAAVQMQTTFGTASDFKSVETSAQKSIENVNKLLKQYDQPAAM
jgi:hypothetical protein